LFSFIYLSSCEIKKDETINNKIIIEDSFTKIDSVVLADSAIKENKVIIPEIDQIRSKDISIEGIRLKDPKAILVTKFGNADSIVKQLNDFNGAIFYTYWYNKSNFSIEQDTITGFEIRDKKFHFEPGDITIGQDESVLKSIFPKSYTKKYYNDKGETIIRVQMDNGADYIFFNINNGKIKEYMKWESW
jgi:hypothetical protein